MKTIYYNSYKVSRRIPLKLISSYLGTPAPKSWEHFIMLGSGQLNSVFKCRTYSKKVLLFDFGSIVFINFNTEEIKIFLHYLESIMDGVDYDMFVRFNERHGIKIYNDGSFSLYKDQPPMQGYNDQLIPVIASILAKSSALSFIEVNAEKLLDEAEIFIHSMQKGRLRSEDRKYASVTAHILRFLYESTSSIRIFDRPYCADVSILSREVYAKLAEHYELYDRFNILDSKTKALRKISSSYSYLSYRQRERRLILFEVFLLALFPLSYLIKYLMDLKNVREIFELLLK